MLNKKFISSVIGVIVFALMMMNASAQKAGFVQAFGKVRKDNRPVSGCEIKISQGGSVMQSVVSKENGSFTFNLDLQKDFRISFSKTGLVAKTIIFDTKVPQEQSDIIFQNEFNIDMVDDVEGVSANDAMNKPVAKISFNTKYEDFVHDDNYTKAIKAEQDKALKDAEAIAKEKNKAHLDSLNKAWSDSLALVRDREAKLQASKAEQERIRAEQEKIRQDSIARSNAALRAAAELDAKEKARQKFVADSTAKAEAEKARLEALAKVKADAEAKAKELARKDSLAKADASLKARQKFVADSTAKAEADKAKQEALTKAQSDAEAKAKELARKDSLAKADASLKARQKFVADSTAKAEADIAKQDALTKAQADAEAKAKELARKDSLAKADASLKARQKFVADSTAQAQADKAKQVALDKAQADAMKAREKFVADSTAKANTEKAKLDAVAKAKADADAKAKADAEAKAKEQERKDALAKTEAEKARQKFVADSTARAEADKAKQDALIKAQAEADAKEKIEAERQKQLAEAKAKNDSIALAGQQQKEKEEADRKAKILADIQAKKDLLGKDYHADDNKVNVQPAKPSTAIPKIRDSDYKEGVTDETITESNRTIYRVVVKKDGKTFNYQRIAYKWGGEYFFRNENNITESTYRQEIKNAKAATDK